MKKTLPVTFTLIGLSFAQILFAQTTVTLTPIQDASVGFHSNYGSSKRNYGTADYYGAFSQPGAAGGLNSGRGIMSFDLSGIPAGSTIVSAKLSMYGRGPWSTAGEAASVGDTGKNSCFLKRITTSWDQNVVTWHTQPTTTDFDEVTLAKSTSVAENYLHINVTQLVADMVADPDNSFGFEIALQTEKPVRALAFWSTNSSVQSLWPHLTITFTSGTNNPTGINAISNKNNGSIIFPDPVVSNATIVFNQTNQQGNLSVKIIDLTGKTIRTYTSASDRLTFSRSGMADGLYFYEVLDATGNPISRGKFIVQ
jgi:hypothetical protein